jgi:hypothetical protein
MGLREWMQRRMASYDGRADLPAHAAFMHAWFTEDRPRRPAIQTERIPPPPEVVEQLRRREEVTAELLQLDLSTADGRRESLPRLQELLRRYPHPVLYDALILAYADAGRWDEARGVAFAARDRRRACERSPHPEIQMETERLRDWTSEDVEELRLERAPEPQK